MKYLSTRSTESLQGDARMPSYLIEQRRKNKLFHWWYRVASPPEPENLASFKETELFRRGRTGSQIIPALYLLLVISLFTNFLGNDPFLIIIVAGGLFILTLATVLNRIGKVNVAGFLVVITFIAYPVADIVTTPGGLNMMTLPLFGFLILPLLCAVSFLPEWWVFVVALANSIFTPLSLIYLPQTAELSAILAIGFANIVTPIILSQMIVSAVAYVWVHSTTQALIRADRAEEIARLEHDLALQAEASAQQKQLLESSIKKIVETHTHVANGDFNARVPLTHDNILWQISGSLNNLLARLQRLRQDASELHQTRLALHQSREENAKLIMALRRTPIE